MVGDDVNQKRSFRLAISTKRSQRVIFLIPISVD